MINRGRLIARRRQQTALQREHQAAVGQRARERGQERAAQPEQARADQARQAIKRSRAAGSAAGQVSDHRPGELIEHQLRLGQALEVPALAQQGRVNPGQREGQPERLQRHAQRERIEPELATQVERADQRQGQRQEQQARRGQPCQAPSQRRRAEHFRDAELETHGFARLASARPLNPP